MARRMRVQVGEQWYVVEMDDIQTNPVRVLVDGEPLEIEVEGLPKGETPDLPTAASSSVDAPAGQMTQVQSPMAGVIVSVAVKVGDRVSAGDQVCVLEAIKLQQSIRAPVAGVVRAIKAEPGQSVSTGDVLVELG